MLFPWKRSPLRQVLEQSDRMRVICLRRGESVINPGRKDIQVSFFQKDTDPSLVFVANLDFSQWIGELLRRRNPLRQVHNGFLRQCGDVLHKTSSVYRRMYLRVLSWKAYTDTNYLTEGNCCTSSRFMYPLPSAS